MSRKSKKSELGKGIRALLSNIEDPKTADPEQVQTYQKISLLHIPLDAIETNPYQPRNRFDKESLEELAQSIRTYGLIQPITVRSVGGDRYQLISGERRARAAQIAGLESIPAYIRVADDQGMLEMALIENVQREDLNAIEVAISFKRLLDECDLTHEELSDRIGKDRSTVTNYTRLLKLAPEIQRAIKANEISMGHARALAGIPDMMAQLDIYRQVIKDHLSVRATERLARNYQSQSTGSRKRSSAKDLEPDARRVRDRLSAFFGRKVGLSTSKSGKGKITITFNSIEDLNDILNSID